MLHSDEDGNVRASSINQIHSKQYLKQYLKDLNIIKKSVGELEDEIDFLIKINMKFKDRILSLDSKLQEIQSKWWYKLFSRF
jgi:predicted RNase H-like nuclease (RuvC/YqgF family)